MVPEAWAVKNLHNRAANLQQASPEGVATISRPVIYCWGRREPKVDNLATRHDVIHHLIVIAL